RQPDDFCETASRIRALAAGTLVADVAAARRHHHGRAEFRAEEEVQTRVRDHRPRRNEEALLPPHRDRVHQPRRLHQRAARRAAGVGHAAHPPLLPVRAGSDESEVGWPERRCPMIRLQLMILATTAALMFAIAARADEKPAPVPPVVMSSAGTVNLNDAT